AVILFLLLVALIIPPGDAAEPASAGNVLALYLLMTTLMADPGLFAYVAAGIFALVVAPVPMAIALSIWAATRPAATSAARPCTRAAWRRIPVLVIELHDAPSRLSIEHEPRAHGRALPGRRGDRHRGAFGLALRHQSRRLRFDRAAAGRLGARRAVAAERARPCRHQRLRKRRLRPLPAPPTAGAVRRRAGDGAGVYLAPARGG